LFTLMCLCYQAV